MVTENKFTGQEVPSSAPSFSEPGNFTPSPPVPTKKKPIALIVMMIAVALVVGGGFLFWVLQSKPIESSLQTFFDYSDADIAKLKALESVDTINVAEVQKWEDRAYDLVEQHGTVDVDASKVYAYLTVAQMDAAALSHQAHGSYEGSIASLSKEILCKFYPDSCSELVASDDAYSKELSNIIFAKVTERMAEDDASIAPYAVQTGPNFWNGPAPQIGLSAGSFKPWLIETSDQFRSTPPPAAGSTEQQAQLKTVKETLAAATNDQKAIVVKWAGGPGTRTPPGIWMTLATDYMHEKAVPLDKYLETKALVAMSMADAVSSVFDSKYTYFYKRPNMFDPSIVTIMPTPNHPSYPAGHATISWAAATALSKYLPENTQEWERLAKEASDSRTIGGIHFPMDNNAGTELGKNVGNEVLNNW